MPSPGVVALAPGRAEHTTTESVGELECTRLPEARLSVAHHATASLQYLSRGENLSPYSSVHGYGIVPALTQRNVTK